MAGSTPARSPSPWPEGDLNRLDRERAARTMGVPLVDAPPGSTTARLLIAISRSARQCRELRQLVITRERKYTEELRKAKTMGAFLAAFFVLAAWLWLGLVLTS